MNSNGLDLLPAPAASERLDESALRGGSVTERRGGGAAQARVPATPTAPAPARVPLRPAPAPAEAPGPDAPRRPFTAARPVEPGPSAELAPAARGRLLFEVDVSSGLRTRPLQCFENSLAFGAEEWTYEEIESICYQLYRFRMGLNPLSEVYEFTLRTRAGRTERVRLVAAFLSSRSVKGDTDLLFQAMVSLLHDRVGRSRNLRYLSQLRAGETVRFGSIRLHRSGVRVRRGPFVRELAWDDVAGAEFVHGMVVVHRTLRDGGTKRCGSVSMSVDNAVLLSDLLPLAVERFGRRANRARRHASA